jgi:3-methyladenine DNA glycosylase AlkD
MKSEDIKAEVRSYQNNERAEILQRFFKTGRGEYAEGDIFYGLTVPMVRSIAKKWGGIELKEAIKLLKSHIHEERLLALFILVARFKKGDEATKEEVYNIYLKQKRYINNWDLVDSSAEHIIGGWLFYREKDILYNLIASANLWDRRIAILATFHFIKKGVFEDSLNIIRAVLGDKHDLIHKAAGWMLREIGKRDFETEEEFLRLNYKKMPRTMLRYAIEKFPEELRQDYLKGRI